MVPAPRKSTGTCCQATTAGTNPHTPLLHSVILIGFRPSLREKKQVSAVLVATSTNPNQLCDSRTPTVNSRFGTLSNINVVMIAHTVLPYLTIVNI
jgi:hypothetical protein